MNCHQNMNQFMISNGCCQVQPIVMPTQVVTRQRVSFCEQPIICPVDFRTVNRVILIPRYYRAYNNACMINPTNNQCVNNSCICPNRQ